MVSKRIKQGLDSGRAAELESKPELESVGVGHFSRSRSRNWSRENLAGSDFSPDSLALSITNNYNLLITICPKALGYRLL